MAEPWLIRFFACNREMQPFPFFFCYSLWGGGGGGDFGSGSGSKFNCAARVGSGRVRRSRVRAGFGLQFWTRADLYMEVISLWHCWCGMEAQVSLTVSFSSSAFFGLLFLIFLLTITHSSSMGFRAGEFAVKHILCIFGHLTNFWCFWQCRQVPNPAGKWNQQL